MSELYDITDEFIETQIGKLYFTKVRDRKELYENHLEYIILQKKDLLDFLKDKEQILYDSLEMSNLFDFLIKIKDMQLDKYGLYEIYLGYRSLFLFCFKKDVFDEIQLNEEFEYYRDLIVEINCIPYQKPNPNPTIAWFEKLEQQVKEKSGEPISFESIYTSVWVGVGVCPKDLTLYEFHKLFFRIGQMKNFDTTTLFKTVDTSGNIQIESWAKDEKKKKKTVSLEELMSKQRKL